MVEMVIGVLLGMLVLLFAGGIYLSSMRGLQAGAKKVLGQNEATLLATAISRAVREGASVRAYQLPDREAPADSGNGLAILGVDGDVQARLEWSEQLQTIVDSTGTRVSAMPVREVVFHVDPHYPRIVDFRFQLDDERGNLIPIESAVAARN